MSEIKGVLPFDGIIIENDKDQGGLLVHFRFDGETMLTIRSSGRLADGCASVELKGFGGEVPYSLEK